MAALITRQRCRHIVPQMGRRAYHGKPGYGHSARFESKTKIVVKSSGPLAWYSRKLDSHPILTKSITSAVIGGSGDVLSQYIEARNEKRPLQWDLVRTSRFGLLGFVLVGPVMHYWYGAIMRWFPGNSTSIVAKRVMLDQFVCSPLFLPTFLSGLWVLEGKDADKLVPTLQHQLPTAIVANWSLWIPSQVVNFSFVSGKYQVLFSNFVGLIWNAYLSYTAHADGDHQHHEHRHQEDTKTGIIASKV
eukprot:CAMPEP_0119009514 /NCGR_PEP_ID=MMETSP1176-20130426/4410_1 /TAXON_ID=265551 /ORGANISM="Synedropsis recta cf, Strain CCMP1620" /LENGTH=245 /DNA_ID=CAMNT_0006962041 /DNA_START=1035 /DNA_END=1772 /DNA_ORIENTATION=+